MRIVLNFNSLRLARFVLKSFCLVALLAGLHATAVGQVFLFDFGAGANTTVGPDDPANTWNNISEGVGTTSTGVLTNIVTTANGASTMGLAMISRFNGANGNGTQTSTLWVSEATRDSLFGNTELFGSLANIFPVFKLTGLEPSTAYDFTFYASRTGVSDNRETVYTVGGATTNTAVLNISANVNNVTTVNGMFPSAEGEITISLTPSANNNNANHFTYLGVLKIVAVPPQTPIVFTLQPTNTQGAEFSDVTFTAAVTGSTPHFVQWLSNGIAIPGANQFSYTIPSVRQAMDGSIFSVNVSNLAFSATSTNAVLRVSDDFIAPTISSYGTVDGLTVDICFSEAVTPETAEEEFNFIIDNVTLPVSAILSTNGRCVTLTLEQRLTGSFTVTVEGVTDLAGHANASITLTVQVPDPESQMVLVDFGGANTTERASSVTDDPIRYWNNLTGGVGQTDSGVLSPLVTTQNLATAIGITMLRRFNGANENGTMDSSAPFPQDATRDSLYGNTEAFNELTDIFPSFKLTGLNPTRTYTLTFYASRTGVTDNRETHYAIEGSGATSVDLNVANNIANSVTASNVPPNEAGEITITLTPGANNNNGNHFTYLGVLVITPNTPGSAGARFLTPTVVGGNIHLQWTGSGQLQSAPTVLGTWSPVTATGVNSHDEPIVLSTNRFFRLLLP